MAGNIRKALRGMEVSLPVLWRKPCRSDWRRTGSRKDIAVAVALYSNQLLL